MKVLLISGIAALVILELGVPASAQAASSPGQIASASEFAVAPSSVMLPTGASVSVLRTNVAQVDQHERTLNHFWIASMLAMAAASGLDAGTSWGKLEGNGLLASPDGTFGARGVSIKIGIAAGVIIPQILFRKHKQLRTAFLLGNFAQAAIFSGVAVHNLGIAPPKQ